MTIYTDLKEYAYELECLSMMFLGGEKVRVLPLEAYAEGDGMLVLPLPPEEGDGFLVRAVFGGKESVLLLWTCK